MNFWTAEQIRINTGGAWVARPKGSSTPQITGLSADSRTLKPGEVFLALRGERFDGHHFLDKAIEAGAALLIIDDPASAPKKPPEGVGVIKVPDCLAALGRLAGAYRRTLESTRVIAVTGSNGKTTTTRLIHAALSTRLRGATSPKSFNNEIGVPLTILSARPGDQYLVCEAGTNAPGELAALGAIIEPDIVVITSIGAAHLEGLGDIEDVAVEKASLLSYLRPGGLAVVTADTDLLDDHLKPAPNVVRFGVSEDADLRLTSCEPIVSETGRRGVRFVVNGHATFEMPIPGEHNALNALAAIAVGRRLGLDEPTIAEGLRTATAPEMRLQIRRIGEIEVWNDAYNANPDSMAAAIHAFVAGASGATRRVAVLGEMLELGDAAPELHEQVAEVILECGGVDLVIAVGPLALHLAERLERDWSEERVRVVPTLSETARGWIAGLLREGDAVLLKGSRRVGLERLEPEIEKRFAGRSKAAGAPG